MKPLYLEDRCIKCGALLPDGETRLMCDECRDYISRKSKEMYQRRRVNHLCTNCGMPLPDNCQTAMCDFCLNRRRSNRKKRALEAYRRQKESYERTKDQA